MPMYTFSCTKCSKLFEIVTKIADRDREILCPHCQEQLKRLLDSPRRINIH